MTWEGRLEINDYGSDVFVIVPARDGENVGEKIEELENFGVSYVVICGEKVNHPHVVYRSRCGKWDAINYGSSFVPKKARVVALNDVDTKICNFDKAFEYIDEEVGLVYCRVQVSKGPQLKFYKILDPIRQRLHIAASGELMLLKKEVFRHVLPVPPCMAEDSYILFKALESGVKAHFCRKTYVTTERTADAAQEARYKRRTTLGIYQALDYTKPPLQIRIFYMALPVFAPLLTLAGEDGQAWVNGINSAFTEHMTNKNPTNF